MAQIERGLISLLNVLLKHGKDNCQVHGTITQSQDSICAEKTYLIISILKPKCNDTKNHFKKDTHRKENIITVTQYNKTFTGINLKKKK